MGGGRPGASVGRLVAHLVLVGLPGVGKSTVGAGVAALLGCEFLDFDVEIERREGRSVAELFRERGEAYFRQRERALTEELVTAAPRVVAPGGGWMAQPGLAALLRPPGRIIYLAVSPATAVARMGRGRAARPLLTGHDPVARLSALLAEREASYRGADAVLDTELLETEQVIRAVHELAPTSGAA